MFSEDIITTSRALAEAAEAGHWDEISHHAWRRADILDGLHQGCPGLREAFEAGERARQSLLRLRANLETELTNLRAARRSAGAWRPYREAAGGALDVTS